ncbi:TPA: hypothetical protein RTU25_001027 [Staphylococcus aureus]|nr:hypothetical protein [Staphylococcus aureus]EJX2090106.1 hypothetical protein [Staphylococcus aureus]ELN9439508.1 hypothetical protein [Staphylococcus aureus]KIT87730.1 hypothetical protein QT22_03925 [Staphylococcus aureus]MBA5948140.1 hypothetical protein [Staphylococcus aureus]MBJ6148139.1 hypothetical protein [Staphylococcus aureus]
MIEYDLTIILIPILNITYLFFKKVEREKWYFSGKEV